jgi:hydroxymethylpyrimidine/phosphomethylpyrimidine kinase
MKKPLKVLCIGGSDSSGGAGIQADLKAVHACGCYGLSVVTAITAQNSLGVQDVFTVPHNFVSLQIESILSDIGTDAAKTGMLWKEEIIRAVARKLKAYKIKKLVIDPVMTAKGGKSLMDEKAKKSLKKTLLPMATVITPNIPEAQYLAKIKIKSVDDMKKAAEVIFNMGAKNVLIKGGHLPKCKTKGSIDVLFDGCNFHEFYAAWIKTKNTHGTGCTFASALAARLAQGKSIVNAADSAKKMVTKAIMNSISLGKGHGAVNAGALFVSRKQKHECLLELQKAADYLMSFKCDNIIPEVSSNLAYAKHDAKDDAQVAGFPGRIIRLGNKAHVIAEPEFGASSHMAHVVLAATYYDPSCRSAMNIKYSEDVISACKKANLKIGSFERKDEPKNTKSKEGMSLQWGVRAVMKKMKITPDIIFDKGGWGKEPMVRVLGKNPMEVVKKIRLIAENI